LPEINVDEEWLDDMKVSHHNLDLGVED
jgi:hypothetical protein